MYMQCTQHALCRKVERIFRSAVEPLASLKECLDLRRGRAGNFDGKEQVQEFVYEATASVRDDDIRIVYLMLRAFASKATLTLIPSDSARSGSHTQTS